MTTETATISLLDYNNNVKPVTYLWICGVGCPAGREYNHDVESDGDEYCDVNEIVGDLGLWSLNGTIVDDRWEWNGVGNPVDERGNSILNVKAI